MRLILTAIVATIAAGWSLPASTTLPALKAERWLNWAPLSAAGLRGKVVLVDFREYTYQLNSHLAVDQGME